jgi:drug/metabolite transporter (DMT)-like permease
MGKKQAPSLAFFTFAIGISALLFSPILLLDRSGLVDLSSEFWGILLITGLCQVLYMGGLAWSYSRGDISVLYPLARGLPVMLVPVVTVGLLGEHVLANATWGGMMLIVVGAFLLPLSNLHSLRLSTYLTPALAFALLAAFATVGYSILDKAALDIMTDHGFSKLDAGLNYMVLQAISTVLWAIPVISILQGERQSVRAIWLTQRRNALLTGIMITSTYGLVLIAMAVSTDVSYVVALRQLSIPIGVLIGVLWLKEKVSRFKLIGVTVMLSGLLLVSLTSTKI